MSSLLFQTGPDEAWVAMDTLAVSDSVGSGAVRFFTSKVFILPHLRLIIAGTGLGNFVPWWLGVVNQRHEGGIDELDIVAPAILADKWTEFLSFLGRVPGDKEFTVTIYHFGFSLADNLIRTYVYRSTNNFRSEPLPYGQGIKPECACAGLDVVKDTRQIMAAQRAEQAKLPPEERVYIGGEIWMYYLNRDGFGVFQVGKFDD